jgi:CDP-diacylglycerol--serine O-phosphatidyltransferase
MQANQKPFIGIINAPNAITLVGLIASIETVFLALRGRFELALIALMFAGLCDIYDGWVARKLKTNPHEQVFGSQLDTIIDMASFGIVPPVFFFALGLNSLLDEALFLFYASCAAMRLAAFNTMLIESDGKISSYTGLPVTYVSWIFPLLMVLGAFTSPAVYLPVARLLILVVAVLFITNVRIPKLRDGFRYALTALTFALTIFWLGFSLQK